MSQKSCFLPKGPFLIAEEQRLRLRKRLCTHEALRLAADDLLFRDELPSVAASSIGPFDSVRFPPSSDLISGTEIRVLRVRNLRLYANLPVYNASVSGAAVVLFEEI